MATSGDFVCPFCDGVGSYPPALGSKLRQLCICQATKTPREVEASLRVARGQTDDPCLRCGGTGFSPGTEVPGPDGVCPDCDGNGVVRPSEPADEAMKRLVAAGQELAATGPSCAFCKGYGCQNCRVATYADIDVPPGPVRIYPSPEPKTIPFDRYTGRVYDAVDDRFYESLGDLLDHCLYRGVGIPADIRTVEEHGPAVDEEEAFSYVRRSLEEQEFVDDAYEQIDARKIEELQVFLDAWWSNTGVVGWWSTQVRLVLSDEAMAYFHARQEILANVPDLQGIGDNFNAFYPTKEPR